MKSICVLLNGGISNDARVIKTVRSLSKILLVDLFYRLPKKTDKNLFNDNVNLIPLESNDNYWIKKIKANLFFYRVYNYYFDYVKKNKHSYNYVWANDLPTLLPAVNIKKHFGDNTELFYDAHEIYSETLNQFFDMNTFLFKKVIFKSLIILMRVLGERKEKKLLNEVDHFITVGDAVADYFHDNLKYERPIVIKNCPSYIERVAESNLFRKIFNISNDDVVFLYQGVLNKGRALTTIINAFFKAEENVKLVVLGNGVLENDLKKIVKESGVVDKIFFKDKVDFKDLFEYTSSADYGINYVESLNESKRLASPNKVFEYIQNEIPILMSKSIENENINDKFNVGVCTELNEQSILNGIKEIQLLGKPNLISNIKKAKKVLNWEAQEKILLCIFNE